MSTKWSPFIKQAVVVGSLAIMAWLLLRLHVLLGPLVLALLLAYFVCFPVRGILRHTGWPRTPVVAGMYLVVVIVLILAPVLIAPRLAASATMFGATLANVVSEMIAAAPPRPITITPSFTIDLGILYAPVTQWLRGLLVPDIDGNLSMQNLFAPFASSAAIVVRSAVSSVVWSLFVLMVSFYVAKDAPLIGRWLAVRLPEPIRSEAQHLWAELTSVWNAFVGGQITLAVIVGVVVWLMMTFLGLRSAPALALLSAFAEFVPGVGPVIAAMVGILIALILGSSWLPMSHLGFAILVALVYFLIQQFENLYLLPRIVGRSISLHPVVVIVGALAGAQVGGVLGILLAAPVIASSRLLIRYTVRKLLDQEPFPAEEAVPERAVLWPVLVREHEVRALLFDLDGTLIQIDKAAVKRLAARLSWLHRIFPNTTPSRLEKMARRLYLSGNLLANQVISVLRWLRLQDLLVKLEKRIFLIQAICPLGADELIPDTETALRALSERYRLAIVTNRPRCEVSRWLLGRHLQNVAPVVVAREDVWHLRPHPQPLEVAAKLLGVPARRCVVIGDTSLDLNGARRAGMLCIGVCSGLGDESDLDEADLVVDSVAQLNAWL